MTQIDPRLKNFKNFVFALWKELRLPEPTRAQYALANALQNGPNRFNAQAFRGVGKSWITSAYVLWRFLWDADVKILVVSASQERSYQFTTFCLRLLTEVEWLKHLHPGLQDGLRATKGAFDVAGCRPAHAPSLRAVGITGQLTGSRADCIIADDVEIPQNSETPKMREKLEEATKEFSAILTPKPDSKIIFLGTPQSQESIYASLTSKGFETWVWPSRYPTNPDIYGTTLAPELMSDLTLDPTLKEAKFGAHGNLGRPTDTRFPEEILIGKELEYGRSGFALQYQLDTSGSDAERFPLKLRDLMVIPDTGNDLPAIVRWGCAKELRLDDYPSVGFGGDHIHHAAHVSSEYQRPQASVLSLDPAGGGGDEFAGVVIKVLNGNFFVVDVIGLFGGHSEENLTKLAQLAQRHKVNEVVIEENFGMGAIGHLLSQHLAKHHPVTVTGVKSTRQKEKRIIEVLEPIANQHRLIFTSRFLDSDLNVNRDGSHEMTVSYRCLHQFTHLTHEKGALTHDDRLDALAQGVAHLVRHLDIDPATGHLDRKKELVEEMQNAVESGNTINYLLNRKPVDKGKHFWFKP